ncbi:PfkB family carbohydrate kinase [Cohnella hashimotonis]|uniref:PfkB family carbohydrate kinase n=1 Tax=Cohnella hashimotonis TaxID=2826895 RepID=A0ABT6TA59_9BACL|nr:PfkB family carbohydrate kinase [Cohnella hashimotonis]MDI4643520.1 PfkB family carbohydrate kinase [Cohnella hashimotonis]
MLDVIALGEVLVDFTPAGDSEQGYPLYEQNPGGAPANVLCGLAKLGRRTSFIGAVGDDPLGRFLATVLEQAGVGCTGLAFIKDIPTTMTFVHLDQDGDRAFRFIRGADTRLTKEEAERELAAGCRVFHFGTLSMTHAESARVTLEAVSLAKQSGSLISFDPNLRLSLWESPEKAREAIFRGLEVADIVKLSEEELIFMTGMTEGESGAELLLRQHAGIRLLLVTLGERGCTISNRAAQASIPGFRVRTVDTTGAGDACMAGLLDQILNDGVRIEALSVDDLTRIGRFANAMGALATTRRGAIPALPGRQDIDNMMNSAEDDPLNDKYRPLYHFAAPANWLNDPNGMVYYEGEYHLFYQHHPHGTQWGPMHWGHALSRDLVRWEHLPVALAPDANGMIFSGSAVVDRHNTSGLFDGGTGLVAIFTNTDTYPDSPGAAGETDRPRQRQSIAYSSDKGRTWTMYANNPVLADESITDFRDPKVFWYEPGKYWVMVLAAGDHIRLYTSPNMRSWTFASTFGSTEGAHEGVWECPDLFQLPVENDEGNAKWVLLVSIGDGRPEGSKTQYFVGEFDGMSFTWEGEGILWMDEGYDNYAGVTWSDIPEADGRRILIGWMSNWKYANATPTSGWRGAMTLPRVLSIKKTEQGIRLCQRPIDEAQDIRIGKRSWTAIQLENDTWSHPELTGDAFELEMVFEDAHAKEFGVRVRQSEREVTTVGYSADDAQLFIDRTKSGESDFHDDFAVRHGAPFVLANGKVSIRLFVDRCSVEAFAGDGEVALTDLIFPDPASRGIELYALGGTVNVASLTIYPLHANATVQSDRAVPVAFV